MKTNKFFAALVMGFAVVACAPKTAEPAADENAEATEQTVAEEAPEAVSAKDLQATKAQIDSVSYLLGVNFGYTIKYNDFGDLNLAQVMKGIKAFLAAEGQPQDEDFGKQFKIDPNEMNQVINSYLEKRYQFKAIDNKEKGEAFLAANAKKAGVQVTESGLQYIIEEAGNEVKATAPQDTIWAKYCGKLLDGTVFDETPEDSEPRQFTLGGVIPGWTEGMKLVGEGGKIKLFIPAELAYGERGNRSIEPNSVLQFDVEITKVGKYVEPVAEEEAE